MRTAKTVEYRLAWAWDPAERTLLSTPCIGCGGARVRTAGFDLPTVEVCLTCGTGGTVVHLRGVSYREAQAAKWGTLGTQERCSLIEALAGMAIRGWDPELPVNVRLRAQKLQPIIARTVIDAGARVAFVTTCIALGPGGSKDAAQRLLQDMDEESAH